MEIPEAVAAFFVGAIVLMPVAAISVRFALKPLLALLRQRVGSADTTAQLAEQSRRIGLLEAELADLHDSVKALTAAADFDRRLAARDPTPGPRP